VRFKKIETRTTKLEIIMKTPLAISDTVDSDLFRHSSFVIRHC